MPTEDPSAQRPAADGPPDEDPTTSGSTVGDPETGALPTDELPADDPGAEDLQDEIRRGQSRDHPIRQRMREFQAWSHRGSRLRRLIVVGLISVVGLVLLLSGVIMWFIPGPGWLFVFLGIGVWSLEFTWAERLNLWALSLVTRAWAWWKSTRLAGWWRWCVSGSAQRRQQAEEAAAAQRQGRRVRTAPHNDVPGG